MATTASRKSGESELISAYSSAVSIRASACDPANVLEPIERIWRDRSLRAPRGGSPRRKEGLSQDPQQIPQVVLGAQHPRLSQDPSERLLNEILGLFARTAEGHRRPVEPIDVVAVRPGVELTAGTPRWCGLGR